jgi:glucose/arabinose dehydrogenase
VAPRQLWAVPDASGSVLAVEEHRGQVVEITPSGTIATRLTGLHQPVAVAEDPQGDYVVAQRNGDVFEIQANGKRMHFYNLLGVTALAMDAQGNSYAASSTYRLVVMHVAATGRDVVVNRDFRSLTGMSATPKGTLWIADKKSFGLFMVVPTPTLTQL